MTMGMEGLQPNPKMTRDFSLRFQPVDHRMAYKIGSYIRYFNSHFLSSIKGWEFVVNDWKRSNHAFVDWTSIPMEQILWVYEHSHTLYLLARTSDQFMFLKAKKGSEPFSNSRIRIYLSYSLTPLIDTIMNERTYTHYITHTRVIE